MFGYATDETEECMPLTVVLAHRLNAKIAELRRSGEFWWARPDSKTQVNHRLFTLQRILNTKMIFHDVKLNNLRLFATLDWTMMQTFIWFHPPFPNSDSKASFNAIDFNYIWFFHFFPQVTCEYLFDKGACIPKRVHTVVVSLQHSEKITLENLRSEVMDKVVKTVIPEQYFDSNTIVHINPCGMFIIGGPMVSWNSFYVPPKWWDLC